jgi:uncharacterized membrane protein YeaQ/YmgE (transglycosylase-associated protein family)
MSLSELIFLLIIASVSGSVGARLAGSSKLGCLGSIALGFIGSYIGQFIAKKYDLPVIFSIPLGDQSFPVIWAAMGAAIFVAVLNLLGLRRRE